MEPQPIPAGKIGENEFYKTVILDSDWALEPHRPQEDDEQVDFQIHLPGDPFNLLLFQVKTAFTLAVHAKARLLNIRFEMKRERLFTHPRFWYFLAHFDGAARTLKDPLFLIPSAEFNRSARPFGKDSLYMNFEGSMEPESRDKWVPYRTSAHGIAQRIEAIFAGLPAETAAEREAMKRFWQRPRAA